MRDLFGGAPTNGHHYLKPLEDDPFRYICGVFSDDGAVEVIKRANAIPLVTYFPIRFNGKGEPVPLWRSYLLVEFREGVTINLCRTSSNFLKIVSERYKDGLQYPVLVRKSSIAQSMAMVLEGKYNERIVNRQFHGRGSIVRVIEGTFIDKRVRLEEDIFPDWKGNRRVRVNIDGVRGTIEVYKLSL
jgi:hypothetical protein